MPLFSLLTSPCLAQDNATDSTRHSVDFGLDLTTAYFFRGIVQEDQGVIAQPWVELGYAFTEGDEDSPSISGVIGTWNSLHSEHTGSTDNGAAIWYESDFYGGLTFGFDTFDLGLSYTVYTYPNSDFNTVQELGVTFGIDLPDDSYGKWLGDLSFGFHFEVDNSNVGDDEAIYFQLDLGPSFEVFEDKATLSIPVTLGLSIDDYYVDASGDDNTFGYLSIGATLEVPLDSVDFGSATFTTGVNFLVLGDATEDANNGDSSDVYAFAGISFSF